MSRGKVPFFVYAVSLYFIAQGTAWQLRSQTPAANCPQQRRYCCLSLIFGYIGRKV